MKFELEPLDIQKIAEKIVEQLAPLLCNDKQDDGIMDKKSVAEYLGVDISWVDKHLYMIPRFKLGKYVRFKKSHIDKWIENNKKTPSPYSKMMR